MIFEERLVYLAGLGETSESIDSTVEKIGDIEQLEYQLDAETQEYQRLQASLAALEPNDLYYGWLQYAKIDLPHIDVENKEQVQEQFLAFLLEHSLLDSMDMPKVLADYDVAAITSLVNSGLDYADVGALLQFEGVTTKKLIGYVKILTKYSIEVNPHYLTEIVSYFPDPAALEDLAAFKAQYFDFSVGNAMGILINDTSADLLEKAQALGFSKLELSYIFGAYDFASQDTLKYLTKTAEMRKAVGLSEIAFVKLLQGAINLGLDANQIPETLKAIRGVNNETNKQIDLATMKELLSNYEQSRMFAEVGLHYFTYYALKLPGKIRDNVITLEKLYLGLRTKIESEAELDDLMYSFAAIAAESPSTYARLTKLLERHERAFLAVLKPHLMAMAPADSNNLFYSSVGQEYQDQYCDNFAWIVEQEVNGVMNDTDSLLPHFVSPLHMKRLANVLVNCDAPRVAEILDSVKLKGYPRRWVFTLFANGLYPALRGAKTQEEHESKIETYITEFEKAVPRLAKVAKKVEKLDNMLPCLLRLVAQARSDETAIIDDMDMAAWLAIEGQVDRLNQKLGSLEGHQDKLLKHLVGRQAQLQAAFKLNHLELVLSDPAFLLFDSVYEYLSNKLDNTDGIAKRELSMIVARNLVVSGVTKGSLTEALMQKMFEQIQAEKENETPILKGRRVLFVADATEEDFGLDDGPKRNRFASKKTMDNLEDRTDEGSFAKKLFGENPPLPPKGSKREFINYFKSAKQDLLSTLSNNTEPLTALFSMHGATDKISLCGYKDAWPDGWSDSVQEYTTLSPVELAEFWPNKLNHCEDILLLSSCYGYDFLQSFYKALENQGKKKPIAIATANIGSLGYTPYDYQKSFEAANFLSKPGVTIGDIIKMNRFETPDKERSTYSSSNVTVFMPTDDGKVMEYAETEAASDLEQAA